mgnify:CR=1 FL=1
MEKSYSESYAAAGVDITAGYRSVELMKQYVARTMNEHCIGGLGGFGGLFELDCTGYKHPVLISGTDGVGTKLKVAMIMDKHDTIGIDCVAMCVNDVICAGAKPLVFLDYIACGKNVPERIAELVAGVAEGCVQAGCALVGGETAEMPGFYPEDEYDLAGFTVGAVDKSKILDNSTMQPGDVIILLGGRTGRQTPRTGKMFLNWATEDVVLGVLKNWQKFSAWVMDYKPEYLHGGHLIDRAGYKKFKEIILDGVELNPECLVAEDIFWHETEYRSNFNVKPVAMHHKAGPQA